MPRGLSIHIGLNSVDPTRYDGWAGQLSGCINDARDMKAIADQLGYTSSIMTDSQASAAAVVQAIGQAAQQLDTGDTLLLTYSGHGGQVPDANGDEQDGQDETWVLWDRMLVDDELYALWSRFRAGVRIFMLSDSCHSGTVAKMMRFNEMVQSAPMQKAYRRTRGTVPKFRLAPWETTHAIYQRDADMYRSLQWVAGGDRAAIEASVILISGCQDNQLSADGDGNGLFTETLKRVWDNGSFSGTYSTFHSAIVAEMPASQTPNLYKVGVANPAFEAEKPFTIGGSGTVQAARPSISAPAQFTNASTPPTFSVNPGANRYYAVEATTNPYFFDSAQYGSQRTDDNFFATWKTPPFLGGTYPAAYTMPQAAWDRLRAGGDSLYYRVWATDSSTAWINASSSTPDAQATDAPAIQLTGVAAGTGVPAGGGQVPSIDASDSVPYATAPSFSVNPGAGRYYAVEVTINPYYFMTSEYGAQRSDGNFFGSWSAPPFLSAPSYPATYTMPQAAWESLRDQGQRLYYRLWATDDPNAWRNSACTTPDAQALQAKSFAIAREAGAGPRGAPDIATPLYNAGLTAMAIQDTKVAADSFRAFLAVAAPGDSRRAYIQRKLDEIEAAANVPR